MLELKLSNGKKLDIEYPIRLTNKQGKVVYHENSDGGWYKREYNEQGKVVYSENSDGGWYKYEYNEKGKEVYYEDSKGIVEDNRPKLKEYSMEELEVILGHPLKIKSKES